MNVGIDFDYTITDNPGFFRELSEVLMRASNGVYVVSSYSKADEPMAEEIFTEKTRMLKEWGIPFKELYLAPEPIADNKAAYCNDHSIGLMIDDTIENLKAINKRAKGTVCLQYIGNASPE